MKTPFKLKYKSSIFPFKEDPKKKLGTKIKEELGKIKTQGFSDINVHGVNWGKDVEALKGTELSQGVNVSGINLLRDFKLGKNLNLSVSNPALVHARPYMSGGFVSKFEFGLIHNSLPSSKPLTRSCKSFLPNVRNCDANNSPCIRNLLSRSSRVLLAFKSSYLLLNILKLISFILIPQFFIKLKYFFYF